MFSKAFEYYGYSYRELNKERMDKILKCLNKSPEQQVIGDARIPLPDYISSLDPKTLNITKDNRDLLWHLINAGRADLVEILLSKVSEISTVHKDIALGNALISAMLNKASSPDQERYTATAILTPYFELARLKQWAALLKSLYTGALNIKDLINTPIDGKILLTMACEAGEIYIVKALLDLGADCKVPSPDTKKYPLHYVLEYTKGVNAQSPYSTANANALVNLIFSKYEDAVSKVDKAGKYPLDYAAEWFKESHTGQEMLNKQQRTCLTYLQPINHVNPTKHNERDKIPDLPSDLTLNATGEKEAEKILEKASTTTSLANPGHAKVLINVENQEQQSISKEDQIITSTEDRQDFSSNLTEKEEKDKEEDSIPIMEDINPESDIWQQKEEERRVGGSSKANGRGF